MRFRLALRGLIAISLLAAAGCDFWSNLVGDKALTRGKLDIDVVDAWTGDTLTEATCGDSLGILAIAHFGNGAYGQANAPTGHYVITCTHPWYHEGRAEASITASGDRIKVKLARRVGQIDWYPDPQQSIRLIGTGGLLRFPKSLDWSATPADENGHFLYEWTFAVNDQFNRGPWQPQRQPPKEAFSPHFRPRISRENNVKPGRDKVTLKVYSLLFDPKQPELVGVDSMDIEWVPNRLPIAQFDTGFFITDSSGKPLPRFPLDCDQPRKKRVLLHLADFDGQCDSVRLWGLDPRSIPYFEMNLTCESLDPNPNIPLKDPLDDTGIDPTDIPSSKGPNGATEYVNTLIAEIVDDNGERARDTVHFRTFRNVPPTAEMDFPGESRLQTHYLMGDSVRFVVNAHDSDGSFDSVMVPWLSAKTNAPLDTGNVMVNIPDLNEVEFSGFVHFHYPESTTFYAKVSDNCAETFKTTPKTVSVTASRPPAFAGFRPTISVRGDTVTAMIELTVSDPDSPYRDKVSSIRVKWADENLDDGGIDSVSPPNSQPYRWDPFHKYVHPAPNAPIRIQIRARDAHDSIADTSYSFIPPGSPATPAALPFR